MILEHEIPKGSRLYFGKSARKKRELEYLLSEMLLRNGFEEIVTPNFSYGQHQSIDDPKKLIKIFDEENNELALRADSSLDVVRIITKRLGRTTSHKKWFYIQPVFNYPSSEYYQIGCEWIEHDDISDIIALSLDMIQDLKLEATLQLSNINIPQLIAQDFNIDIDLFKNADYAKIEAYGIDWLNKLLQINTKDDISDEVLDMMPQNIKEELIKLKNVSMFFMYDKIVLSPLYYTSIKYYDDIYYRVIYDNLVLMIGGSYKSEEIDSLGFALYTDNVMKIIDK
ncbi:MAG: ATP phosphoribosyltransferase regulatory subunit [Arcobacteraceae bacterium]|nr:ATP phosphoribosyltransferase regulatory subunit [Arcobacteraceae bacterium]MDY0365630.1 ATP phosphoribosyltransferase regulatory subunit [Arcobacteraceae bacterium]